MRSPYRSQEDPGPSQAGKYQCYSKASGCWLPIGSPMSRPQAFAEVAMMKQEGRLREPHCVPL